MQKLIDAFSKAMPANPKENAKVSIALDITTIANGIKNELEEFKTDIQDEISTSSIDITFSYKDGGSYKSEDGILNYANYTMNLTLKFGDAYEDPTMINDLENLLKKIQTYVVTSDVDVKKLATSYDVKPGKPVVLSDDDE